MAIDLLENCSLCYQFALSEFPTQIIIDGDLDPTKEYYFKVTDKFNNSYVTIPLTPDTDGIVTIQVLADGYLASSFVNEPSAAWFNKNAGIFTIEASLETPLWAPETFTFQGLPYECIAVQFFNDDSEKNTIL